MAGGGALPARDANPVASHPVGDRTDGDAEAGGRPPAAAVASRDVPFRPALLRWRGGADEPSRPCPGRDRVLTDVHHRLAETTRCKCCETGDQYNARCQDQWSTVDICGHVCYP